jgi:hypothetical protein
VSQGNIHYKHIAHAQGLPDGRVIVGKVTFSKPHAPLQNAFLTAYNGLKPAMNR